MVPWRPLLWTVAECLFFAAVAAAFALAALACFVWHHPCQ